MIKLERQDHGLKLKECTYFSLKPSLRATILLANDDLPTGSQCYEIPNATQIDGENTGSGQRVSPPRFGTPSRRLR